MAADVISRAGGASTAGRRPPEATGSSSWACPSGLRAKAVGPCPVSMVRLLTSNAAGPGASRPRSDLQRAWISATRLDTRQILQARGFHRVHIFLFHRLQFLGGRRSQLDADEVAAMIPGQRHHQTDPENVACGIKRHP